jgi:hypothetical protein
MSGNATSPNSNQHLIDELIFKRDVNEGFLLIDYISGRTEKSLKDLDTDRLEVPSAGQKATNSQIWKRFCEIRYPPSAEPGVKAENAAFVLEMKDRLTALARPARGLTIAYTAIFVGNVSVWRRNVDKWTRGRNADHQVDKNSESQRTQVDQAVEAFPSIELHARRFAWLFGTVLPVFLLFWFLLTAFTYWDVAYGGSILQTLQQLDVRRTALLQSGPNTSGRATTVSDVCNGIVPNSPDTAKREEECAKLPQLVTDIDGARANLLNFYNAAIGEHAWYNLPAYVRPIRWGFLAYNPRPYNHSPEQSITCMLTLFGTYVLPSMFGLLGTMAAVVRVIQAKVRDSLLSPRDLSLSLLGLLIGPLAGLAVGLFYTPSAATTQSTAGLAGTITLTVSGLGFLAGYGADAFFKFLDALLVRVFALDAGSGSK